MRRSSHYATMAALGCMLPLILPPLLNAGVEYRVLESEQPGPTVMIHAPEKGAGHAALRQLQHNPPSKGTLVLVMETDGGAGPPMVGGEDWQQAVSMEALRSRFPDSRTLVFRQDEETHAYDANFRGDSVQGPDDCAVPVMAALKQVPPPAATKDWRRIPMTGDHGVTTVTVNGRLDMSAGLRPALREREFRAAAMAMLAQAGMTSGDSSTMRLFPLRRSNQIRIAVYDDLGAQSSTGRGPGWLRERLAREPDLVPELVGAPEILGGALERADVLLIGGGKANLESEGLGQAGRDAVRRFVASGGGFVGICAGAYLASSGSGKTECLNLLPVLTDPTWLECFTPLDWAAGPVRGGQAELADLHGGPMFNLPEDSRSRVSVWASFKQNETHQEKGLYRLEGTPAVVAGNHGDGRVVLTSTHCERPPSPPSHFPRMIRWAGRN